MELDKKLPFWLLFPPLLQISYMTYLFQKNGQILIVLLGMSIFIIFALIFHYKGYVEKLEAAYKLYGESEETLKAQHEGSKYLARMILLLLLFSVLLSVLFKINVRTTSSFVIYSGVLGTLFAKGIYDIERRKNEHR